MVEQLTKKDIIAVVDHARDRILSTMATRVDVKDSIDHLRDQLTFKTQDIQRENQIVVRTVATYFENQSRYNMSLELRLKILERELVKTHSQISELIKALRYSGQYTRV